MSLRHFCRRIITIDCRYLHPQFAAAYLLIDCDPSQPLSTARAAFVDNNTSHSIPLLLETLQQVGLTPAQVEYVIITHVHLDHAGGTSQLMKACPQATLLAHPRAARHMVDPAKLVKSARQVYGDDAFDRMYGLIEPIAAERVRLIEDEAHVHFGTGGPLRFIHTRGHANHHFCIFEPETLAIFTGDTFGLTYPALQRHGLFALPSTSPTDFDYAAAIGSIDKIVATGARHAYPTHYGAVENLEEVAHQLKTDLAFSQELVEQASRLPALDDAQLSTVYQTEITTHLRTRAQAQGLALTAADLEFLRLDLELNAQGLVFAARSARRNSSR